MRYLWVTSFTIVFAGVALTVGGMTGVLNSIALICGLLLLWTGIVKIVALRIWRRSLSQPPPTPLTARAETMSQVSRSPR